MSAAKTVRGDPAAPKGRCASRPSSARVNTAAPVVELVDVVRRLAREDLDRVLVGEEVGALHRVERVRLGRVRSRVPECRVDPALGRAGVAAGRVELRDDSDVGPGVVRRDGRAHPCATRADDEHVVRAFPLSRT